MHLAFEFNIKSLLTTKEEPGFGDHVFSIRAATLQDFHVFRRGSETTFHNKAQWAGRLKLSYRHNPMSKYLHKAVIAIAYMINLDTAHLQASEHPRSIKKAKSRAGGLRESLHRHLGSDVCAVTALMQRQNEVAGCSMHIRGGLT